MSSFKKTGTVLAMCMALHSTHAMAWEGMWERNFTPVVQASVTNNNTVGVSMANMSGHGIQFFNPDTGNTFCTYPLNAQLYYTGKPGIYGSNTDRVMVSYVEKTAANATTYRLKLQAFRINNLPNVNCSQPEWTWTTPFNVHPLLTHKASLSKDGNIATLILSAVPDPTTGFPTTQIYTINASPNPATGAAAGTVASSRVTNFMTLSDSVLSISENGHFALAGGKAWKIDLNTRVIGPDIFASADSMMGGAINNNGVLVKTSSTLVTVAVPHLDATIPYYGAVFTFAPPSPYCGTVAVSNAMAGVACSETGSRHVVVQSFALQAGIAQQRYIPVNSWSGTSTSPNWQYVPTKMAVYDRSSEGNAGKVVVSLMGDAGTSNPPVPEFVVLSRSGPAVEIQRPGSGGGFVLSGNNLWMASREGHDNSGASGGRISRWVDEQ